jgi:hypothetical protein
MVDRVQPEEVLASPPIIRGRCVSLGMELANAGIEYRYRSLLDDSKEGGTFAQDLVSFSVAPHRIRGNRG